MQLKSINTNQELLEAISIAFFEDEELFSKYHILEGTYHDCVNDTYKKILDANAQYPLEWFEIISDSGKKIGFLVICKAYNFLYSFGINKFNRDKETTKRLFKSVKILLGDYFTCSLWSKNTRAIDFLVKNGMAINRQENNQTYLSTF